MSKQLTTQQFFNQPKIKQEFEKLLGKKSKGFITSVMQVVGNNSLLAKATPESIFQAAAMSAVLDLPINNNLGEAYIVPYGGKAQFQLGYKGFITLAIRSGQYETISSTPIYKEQLIENDPLTGFKFDFTKPATGTPIGYAAYFKLHNGFSKVFYMSREDIGKHAKKYSKSINHSSSIWKSDFDGMAQKTVLKLLISKYGPKSLEMQKAVISDQSVINDYSNDSFEYPDSNSTENETKDINQEFEDAEIIEDDDEDIV
jgi:recombination protein RecT